MRRCRPAFAALGLLATLASGAHAQGLRSKIDQLFIFGSGGDPLFLAGSADPNNPASIQAHGTHFVPSAVSQNGSIISFLTTAIAGNVSNAPIGSTSGGETFRFEAGVPVRTSPSAGPIFAERAQTLGRGRTAVGIGRTSSHFTSLRGVPLQDIDLYFTHENVDFAGLRFDSGRELQADGHSAARERHHAVQARHGHQRRRQLDLRHVRPVRQRRRRHRPPARIDVDARPQRRADHSVRRANGGALLCRHADQSGAVGEPRRRRLGLWTRRRRRSHQDRNSSVRAYATSRCSPMHDSPPATPSSCSAPDNSRRADWRSSPDISARSRRTEMPATSIAPVARKTTPFWRRSDSTT